MVAIFKCSQCVNVFQADSGKGAVHCPRCDSTEVEEVKISFFSDAAPTPVKGKAGASIGMEGDSAGEC